MYEILRIWGIENECLILFSIDILTHRSREKKDISFLKCFFYVFQMFWYDQRFWEN